MTFTRENKFHSILISIVLVVFFSITGCGQINDSERPPNIILIVTDDQHFSTLEYMPVVWEELAQKGIIYTNGYVTTPACCPSRASILTGLYAHNHGVLANKFPDGGALKFDDASTLATWLKTSGYKTGLIGKYLNENSKLGTYIPPGWDEWHAFSEQYPGKGKAFYRKYSMNSNGKLVNYTNSDKDYSTLVLKEKALDFITKSKNTPYFLYLNFFAPHEPYNYSDEHANLFTDLEFPLPPNFYEKDVSDKPAWVKKIKHKYTEEEITELAKDLSIKSLRTLASVDDAVGEIINTLEKTKQRDNTVIIFISDNGLAWGEHRRIGGKGCPYEECAKVPFVIYHPGILTEGRTDNNFVLNIDLAPTIAEIAGAKIPVKIDGKSFLPLLSDPNTVWRDKFIIEHFQENFLVPPFKALRTTDWKYIEYESGEFELYDMIHDPWEMDNLAGLEEYAEVMAELKAQLQALLEE